jgi:hypothetical protein
MAPCSGLFDESAGSVLNIGSKYLVVGCLLNKAHGVPEQMHAEVHRTKEASAVLHHFRAIVSDDSMAPADNSARNQTRDAAELAQSGIAVARKKATLIARSQGAVSVCDGFATISLREPANVAARFFQSTAQACFMPRTPLA